jgi:hypothetical protein
VLRFLAEDVAKDLAVVPDALLRAPSRRGYGDPWGWFYARRLVPARVITVGGPLNPAGNWECRPAP